MGAYVRYRGCHQNHRKQSLYILTVRTSTLSATYYHLSILVFRCWNESAVFMDGDAIDTYVPTRDAIHGWTDDRRVKYWEKP